MNRRQQSKAESYRRLLAAAEALFAQRGYASVGMRDIAAAAGRSTGAVFMFWTSKDDVWRAAMGRQPPDPATFARLVLAGQTLEHVHAAAAEFLWHTAGREGQEAGERTSGRKYVSAT